MLVNPINELHDNIYTKTIKKNKLVYASMGIIVFRLDAVITKKKSKRLVELSPTETLSIFVWFDS